VGLIDTSLQIGKSALLAQSLAMDVVGNNIANAGTDGYARQVADLRTARGIRSTEGLYLGLGVHPESIRRISDAYLEQRLRDARSGSTALTVQDEAYQRLEGVFNELSDTDLSTIINEFFTALNNLQNTPEDRSVRRSVVESAKTFTETINLLRTKIDELRKGLDTELVGSVDTVNSITSQIAELNVEISKVEAGGAKPGSATALRDRRDLLLSQLSDILQIRAVELDSGMVNVFAGSDPLVMDNQSYELTTESSLDAGTLVHSIVFESDGRPLTIKGGSMRGIIDARDTGLVEFINSLDEWTAAFIDGFNRIHSGGQGLDMYRTVTGTNGVDDPTAVLNAAGLDFAPVTGTFDVQVKNSTSGETRTFRFHVDLDGLNGDDTTLSSLIADLNAQIGAYFPQITASLGPGNTLDLTSTAGELAFSFSDDTSGVLACLGVNTFFTGKDSTDIAINDRIDQNPGLIAAATTALPGDNSNVAALIAFQREPLDSLGGTSVDAFYQSIVATLGIRAGAARDRSLAGTAILSAIQSQRETLSGVSLDEEAVKLIQYQSGYRAAARFITTIQEMINTLLTM